MATQTVVENTQETTEKKLEVKVTLQKNDRYYILKSHRNV